MQNLEYFYSDPVLGVSEIEETFLRQIPGEEPLEAYNSENENSYNLDEDGHPYCFIATYIDSDSEGGPVSLYSDDDGTYSSSDGRVPRSIADSDCEDANSSSSGHLHIDIADSDYEGAGISFDGEEPMHIPDIEYDSSYFFPEAEAPMPLADLDYDGGNSSSDEPPPLLHGPEPCRNNAEGRLLAIIIENSDIKGLLKPMSQLEASLHPGQGRTRRRNSRTKGNKVIKPFKKNRKPKFFCEIPDCADRGLGWTNRRYLIKHLRDFHGLYIWKCTVCGDVVNREDAFIPHFLETGKHSVHRREIAYDKLARHIHAASWTFGPTDLEAKLQSFGLSQAAVEHTLSLAFESDAPGEPEPGAQKASMNQLARISEAVRAQAEEAAKKAQELALSGESSSGRSSVPRNSHLPRPRPPRGRRSQAFPTS